MNYAVESGFRTEMEQYRNFQCRTAQVVERLEAKAEMVVNVEERPDHAVRDLPFNKFFVIA